MPNARTALALAAASIYAASALAAPALAGQACILGANGQEDCSHSSPSVATLEGSLSVVVRPKACADGDTTCFCLKAVEITNQIRAEAGKGPLKPGPQAMLDNAIDHDKDMSNSLGMVHQDLKEAGKKVGCDVFVNRENVAWFMGMDNDPAEQLMKQWKESPGHYKNIVGAEDGDYVAIGVYTAADGKTWGTQTFAQGETDCPMIGGDEAAGKATKAPVATTEAPAGDAYKTNAPATTAAPAEDDYYKTKAAASTAAPAGAEYKTNAPADKPAEETPCVETPDQEVPAEGGGETASGGPCADGDVKCACIESVAVTNRIRAKHGKGPLVVGPMEMLDNAVEHSKVMATTSMHHQDLGAAADKVGCGLFIRGENVAQNNVDYKEAAEVTMKQWEDSPGHFQNIINQKDGSYVVVGVYKAPDGKMWGTQTFGSGDCSCPLVSGGGGKGKGMVTKPGKKCPKSTTSPSATTQAPAAATTQAPYGEKDTDSAKKTAAATTAAGTTASPAYTTAAPAATTAAATTTTAAHKKCTTPTAAVPAVTTAKPSHATEATAGDDEAPECYETGERNEGAPGYPHVAWAPCCETGEYGQEVEGDWGKFCKKGGAQACYKTGERNQGAAGHPYVAYAPCCEATDVSLEKAGDWGFICTSPDGDEKVEEEIEEELVDKVVDVIAEEDKKAGEDTDTESIAQCLSTCLFD